MLVFTVSPALWLVLADNLEDILDYIIPEPTAEDVERGLRPLMEHDAEELSDKGYILGLDEDATQAQKEELLAYLKQKGCAYMALQLIGAVDVDLTPELVTDLQSGRWPIVLSLERNMQIEESTHSTSTMSGAIPVSMPGSRVSRRHLRNRKLFDDDKVSSKPVMQNYTDRASNRQPAVWHLDFLDNQPSDGQFDTQLTGEGVDIYIVDTGIRRTHSEFTGRVSDAYYGTPVDRFGHGTAMAGAAIGTVYGAAKKARAVSVQVVGRTGRASLNSVLGGLTWIYLRAPPSRKAIVSMSLGGRKSMALDNAVQNLVLANLPTVVAAGNHGSDACDYSPAGAPAALTVGAIGQDSQTSIFSNTGSCVDLYAPGEGILSASHRHDRIGESVQGTSPACAIAAGVASLYLEAGVAPNALFPSMLQATRLVGSRRFLQLPNSRNGTASRFAATFAPTTTTSAHIRTEAAPATKGKPTVSTSRPTTTTTTLPTTTVGYVKHSGGRRSLVSPTFRVGLHARFTSELNCQCTSNDCNIDLYVLARFRRQWTHTPVALSRSRTSRERVRLQFLSSASVIAMAYARRGDAKCTVKATTG